MACVRLLAPLVARCLLLPLLHARVACAACSLPVLHAATCSLKVAGAACGGAASVISIALVDASPGNRTYCNMSRANGRLLYGDGAEAGNEEGYLVGYVNCEWTAAEPLLVDPSQPMRIVVEYDARVQQLGIMAKMELIAIGVRDKDGAGGRL